MSPLLYCAIYGPIGAIAVWRIRSDLRSGVAAGRLWSYTIDDNPLGFGFVIAGKSLIAAFCVAEVLFGLGLAHDPVPMIQQAFRSWFTQ